MDRSLVTVRECWSRTARESEIKVLFGYFFFQEKVPKNQIQSNKKMWELLEQRKTLNASVAHDLRTPITVLKGYLDYLKKNVPQGKLTNEALMETVSNMQEAVGRLERYVECVRDIENIENIQVQCCNEDVAKLCSQIEDDIHHLTTDKKIVIANSMTSETVYITSLFHLSRYDCLRSNGLLGCIIRNPHAKTETPHYRVVRESQSVRKHEHANQSSLRRYASKAGYRAGPFA